MRTVYTPITKSSLVVSTVIALFCSLTVLMPSTVQAQDKIADLPLYPLKNGLKWTYLATNCDDNKEEELYFEVTNTSVFNKLVCYEVAYAIHKSWSANISYIAVKDDGLYLVGEKFHFSTAAVGSENKWCIHTYEPPICILKPAKNKTQTWTTTTDYRKKEDRYKDGELTDSCYSQQIVETYHQFTDTIKHNGKEVVATRVTVEDENGIRESWYLPGEGVIKFIHRYTRSKHLNFNSVLVKFSGVNSVKIGDIVLKDKEPEQNKEITKKKTDKEISLENEITNNNKMLVFGWYKEKYEIAEWGFFHYFNRLHVNLLLLGLFLYPILTCFLSILAEKQTNQENIKGLIGGSLVIATGIYPVVLVLSFVISAISYLAVGFFSNQGQYIPYDFASFCLHILILLFLALWLLSLLLPVAWKIKLPGIQQAAQPVKIGFNYVAMIKALAIMIVSALASQFAGWIAGAIVLAIGAGFAMVTSD